VSNSQLGLEKTPDEYVANMVAVFREVKRVLKNDGTLWLNLGDSYASDWPCNRRSVVGAGSLPNGKRAARPPRLGGVLKPKDLVGIPWRVAFALQADGWWLRSDIIWAKQNCMPESVTDRPTKSHEYIFLLTKNQRYYYDAEAIKEPASESMLNGNRPHGVVRDRIFNYDSKEKEMRLNGIRPRSLNAKQRTDSRGGAFFKNAEDYAGKNGKTPVHKNSKQRGHSPRHEGNLDDGTKSEQCSGMRNKRDVWTVATAPYSEAHFATFPPDLIKPCVLAGTKVGDTVLDPFAGSGTTGEVALELGRSAILIELNPKYISMIKRRCDITPGLALA
jgi:DNA modification methylase